MIPEHVVKNEELRDKIIELICDNNFIKKIPPEISTCEQMVSESRYYEIYEYEASELQDENLCTNLNKRPGSE